MRLFVAIDLPSDVRSALATWCAKYSPTSPGYKWVKPESLHITVKFIGERPETDVPAISQTLGKAQFPKAIPIAIAGIGSFPNVLYAHVIAPESLPLLARSIDEALETLGIPVETRAYTPHLTVARRKDGVRLPKELGANERFGSFSADEFTLYQSVLGSSGSTYKALRRFRCQKL